MTAAMAVFSPDRQYRYRLTRRWEADLLAGGSHARHGDDLVAFIALNPSTADETADDPTVRRCRGFARAWGFGGFVLVNLFALRATDPRALRAADDPVGAANDCHILHAVAGAARVVPCWGNHGAYRNRSGEVRMLLRRMDRRRLGEVLCFGMTAAVEPRHPLYLPAGQPLRPFDLGPCIAVGERT